MQDNRSINDDLLLDPDRRSGEVLALLLDAHPSLQSKAELARLMAGSTADPKSMRLPVEDGLADLVAYGLAHLIDDFAFASQSAVKSAALLAAI